MPAPKPNTCGEKPSSAFICSAANPTFVLSSAFQTLPNRRIGKMRYALRRFRSDSAVLTGAA